MPFLQKRKEVKVKYARKKSLQNTVHIRLYIFIIKFCEIKKELLIKNLKEKTSHAEIPSKTYV